MSREPSTSYTARLGVVLSSRDPVMLRAFLIDNAQRFGDQRQVAEVEGKSDEEMEELMHRMIVSRPDLKELHRTSREWLFTHDIDSFGPGGGRRN